tara:strand:- start:51 stop:545 length:495 start_codon:yes stop_codon:yes gene_type:complete
MVNRIQNRNSGYSDAALFSKGTTMQNNSVNSSISGATALKLDEQFEVGEDQQSSLGVQEETIVQNNNEEADLSTTSNNFFENETSMESSVGETFVELDSAEHLTTNSDPALSSEEEYTPKLFSEDISTDANNIPCTETEQKLFSQESSQEEDFEIPAFLRRQKF